MADPINPGLLGAAGQSCALPAQQQGKSHLAQEPQSHPQLLGIEGLTNVIDNLKRAVDTVTKSFDTFDKNAESFASNGKLVEVGLSHFLTQLVKLIV
jgi:hypothetical protein